MATAGSPGVFEARNSFKTTPQLSQPGFNPPSSPYPPLNYPSHPSSHPFPSNNFTPNSYTSSSSAFPSLPGSYPFPLEGSMYNPYVQYSQDNGPWPPTYPPPPLPCTQSSFSQPLPPPSLPHSAPPRRSLSQINLQSSSLSLDGARLMALLTTNSSGDFTTLTSLELPPAALSVSEPFLGSFEVTNTSTVPLAPPVSLAPHVSTRLSSSKFPRGRYLKGDHVVYDVDVRLPGEAQPQLEVSPITVYVSDPILVVGRQIAVNRSYICYGLRAGTIRILNINTGFRALLRGHSQRVTDMAFFAEDVDLLASASSDGRVFVRRIVEGFGEDGKMQITDHILLAIQIVGDWKSGHPRVCWHSHMQDLLVVGIGIYVLTIEISKVRLATSNGLTVEDLVECPVDNPVEGVQCVGGLAADVTDLSTSQWTQLACASKDGTVQIFGDKEMQSSTFMPHEGPVGSVAFLSAPHHPDHVVLLTAGPLNRILKLWVPSGGDGWFPQSGGVNLQCIQTLELKSSTEPQPEVAFFNQVLIIPRACLILLANAKKNSIYVVHIDFGSNPSATRMDYIAEFCVTMPILSLTATSENVLDGEGVVQVYCVQTRAIQQYSLDLSQCLPPPVDESIRASGSSLEKGLISSSHVSDVSMSVTSPPVETMPISSALKAGISSVGRQAKSPGPSIAKDKDMIFRGSLESPGSQDQLHPSKQSAIFLDSKVAISSTNKEGKEIVTRENLPSIPDVVTSAPHVGMVPLNSRGSPLARCSSKNPDEKGLRPFGSSPEELVDKMQVHEYSVNRINDSAPDSIPVSPQRIFEEGLRNSEERGWQVSSPKLSTAVMLDEQNNSMPVHLITPSELMSMVARSKSESDGGSTLSSPRAPAVAFKDSNIGEKKLEHESVGANDVKMETKGVAQISILPTKDPNAQKGFITESVHILDVKERIQTGSFEYSVTTSLKESDSSHSLHPDQVSHDETQQCEEEKISEEGVHSMSVQVDEVCEQLKEVSGKATDSRSVPAVSQSPAVSKGRKNKNKTNASAAGAAAAASSSIQAPSAINMATSEGELGNSSSINVSSSSNLAAEILAMQGSLNQLVGIQKELQKQMTVMVAVPVAKEGKRMEAALGQRIEKVLKAHVDAMCARIQEENAKREKSERERMQQLTTLISNSINKDLPAALERFLKKEMSFIGPIVVRLVTPSIEKAIPTAVNEAFQKGINEKGVVQLEKSVGAKLEAAVSRQLQINFQTTGRNALQEALRSSFEGSVIPAFEQSCQVMFQQVDAAFQKGMAEHTTHAHQVFSAPYSVLATTLQDTITLASSLAACLKGELVDGQRKLLALAESAGAAHLSFGNKQNNGSFPDKRLEQSLHPTLELSRLVSEGKLEEAFDKALSRSDVAVVSWLCTQVDPAVLFTTVPVPLSQAVLLSLVLHLGHDLGKDTARKLTWMREAALALNPNDPVFAPYVRQVLEQVYQSLHGQMLLTNVSVELANSMRLVIHVVNSLLTTFK